MTKLIYIARINGFYMAESKILQLLLQLSLLSEQFAHPLLQPVNHIPHLPDLLQCLNLGLNELPLEHLNFLVNFRLLFQLHQPPQPILEILLHQLLFLEVAELEVLGLLEVGEFGGVQLAF
jgi:hypothetical protein